MERFQSFIELVRGYKIEAVLLCVAGLIALISAGIYFADRRKSEPKQNTFKVESQQKQLQIFVDVEGAVKKPGVYGVPENSRLKEAILMAGGISQHGDRDNFTKNFNQAKILSDQEKIYVPFVGEERQPIDNITDPNATDELLININTASEQELDQLPGVGKVTAQKIVNGRPYLSTDEVLTKKIINNSTYEKIKNQISIN